MSDEGATPRELLLESCRRNNTSLLSELLSSLSSSSSSSGSGDGGGGGGAGAGGGGGSKEKIARLLNESRDPLGCFCLHVAAGCGSYEVLDSLLDQEGLEVDPVDRLEGDIPLHKAVRFANGLSEGQWGAGVELVELLLDAGADPRIRNKAKLKPAELVDPRNTELKATLQKAEFAMMAGDDVVDADDDAQQGGGGGGATGSASDSE